MPFPGKRYALREDLMATGFQIPEVHTPALLRFQATSPEQLASLTTQIISLGQVFDPDDLSPLFDNTFGQQYGSDVLTMLLSLATSQSQKQQDMSMVLQHISDSLSAHTTDDDDPRFDPATWPAVSKHLATLVSSPQLATLAKVVDLAYDHPHILHSTRILTDIRPVFTTSEVAFSTAIVTQTLRLKFFKSNEFRLLNLAMDEQDIRDLRDACDRAIQKADAARRALEPSGVSVGILGRKRGT